MYLDTIAFKKWSVVLSEDSKFDKDTFLLTSILPYTYVSIITGGNRLILVDLQQISEYTSLAYKGFCTLVDNGYASWLHKDTNFDTEKEYQGTIIVGEYKGIRPYLFIENKIIDKKPEGVNPLFEEQKSNEIPYLNEIFTSYEKGAKTLGYSSKVAKAVTEVKLLISKIKGGKATRIEFLKYFYYLNYMLLNMVNLPSDSDIRKKSKELKVATEVLGSLSEDEAVAIVPYFIYNYPSYAPKNYPDTNIWTLKFSLTTTLKKMRGVESGVGSFKKATTISKFGEDDRL